jgi:hypothetical protein
MGGPFHSGEADAGECSRTVTPLSTGARQWRLARRTEGRPGGDSDDGPARRVNVGDPRRGAVTGLGESVAIGVIVAAKFGLPLLILRFPFAAGWANFFLDSFDGDLLIPLGLPNEVYQPVDKITDWVTYVAIVVFCFRHAWPTRRLMLVLFLYRSVGQITFLVTENELVLALFPNFLEPLFLVTVTILTFERVARGAPDWQERGFAILYRFRWLIGSVIVVYKLIDEYITHVGNIDRSELLQRLLGG